MDYVVERVLRIRDCKVCPRVIRVEGTQKGFRDCFVAVRGIYQITREQYHADN